MDCWLSYTLGYTSEVTPQDISIACPVSNEEVPIDEQIHVQTSKIGLIAADISKAIATPELSTRENIQVLADRLEVWRLEVPPMLSIALLTSPNPPPMNLYQRRAILMVHVSRADLFGMDLADQSSDYVPWCGNPTISPTVDSYCRDAAHRWRGMEFEHLHRRRKAIS